MRIFWVLGLIVLFASCKSTKKASSAASEYANYQEDLSSSLPQYADFRQQLEDSQPNREASSGQSVDDELSQFQERLISKNKSEPYFNGFSVLVYSGVDRNAAFKSREKLEERFPDLDAEMQYEEPRYLLKVGKFAYKIEAQKSFSMIKDEFPTARIIQDRFQRKEFVFPNDSEDAEGED